MKRKYIAKKFIDHDHVPVASIQEEKFWDLLL